MKRPILFGVFVILASVSLTAADTIEVPSDYHTIQEAIDAAADYDIIVVRNGIYFGANNVNLDFDGKKITLRSKSGPASCVINGALAARAFIFQSGENSETVVEGFTIMAGLANYGGAIECYGSSPTIKNCMFINNTANFDGGAIDCYNSSPVIKNCVFNTNTADGFGGAIECYQSAPTIKNCLFVGNYAGINGGAVDCYSGSEAIIINCTIVDNSNGTGVAGGISSGISPNPVITNCILWDNTGDLDGCSATFSCIEDGDSGLGNISSNPLFRDGPTDSVMGGYYLSNTAAGQLQNSPCIDKGVGPAVPFAEPNSFTTRTDSLADVGIVDMGFHYPDTSPATEYLLTTSVVDGNGLIHPDLPDPGSFYRAFTDVRLTATPEAGYKVKQWTGANNVPAPKTNNNIVTIIEDTNVTVEFEPLATYQLTTAVDIQTPYGTIIPSSGPYQEDSVVTVTAIPAEGYRVETWNGMWPDPYDPNHFTVLMDSDKTVTVRFISKYITRELTVEILDVNGDPAPSLGMIEPRRGGTYLIGTVVEVIATPISQDYEIKKWTGTNEAAIDPATTDSHQTVTMTEDKHVTVTIGKRIKYYLTVWVSTTPGEGDGTVDPCGGPIQYYEGDVVTIEANSLPGYELKWWKINGVINWPENGDNYNVLTLTMDSDKDVEAAFWKGCSVSDSFTLRFETIQEAIDKAGDGQYVRVGDGVWTGEGNRDLVVRDVSIDIFSRNGPQNCIIDCGGSPGEYHRGFDFNEIWDVNLGFTIEGFTIRNGFAEYGGGIHLYDVNASITIENFMLENNNAEESGGGIYCYETLPIILNTEFLNNTSQDTGGGISCDSNSHADIINCLFAYNHSEYEGGGIYIDGSDPNILLCTVAYNTSNAFETAGYLSGIYADNSEPNISNCIVGRNDNFQFAPDSVWGDEYYGGDDLFGCAAVYSCIENGDTGEGNTSGDPVFITGPFGDFYLTEIFQYIRNIYGGYDIISPSACIDTGLENLYTNLQGPPYELPGDLTTSVFSTPDDDFTDMGYHYPPYTRGIFKYEITVSAGTNGIVRCYEITDLGYIIGPPLGEVTQQTSPITLELVPYTKIRLAAVPDPNYRVYYWQRNNIYDYSYYNNVDFYAMDDEYFRATFELLSFRTIHVPGLFPYIGVQDAINSARDGDTIVIAPGTYPGSGFYVDRAITIASEDPEDPCCVAATIIDCNIGDLGIGARGFLLDDIGQGPALLNGLTIINGRSSSVNALGGLPPGGMGGWSDSGFGGGVSINGDHTVKNCILRNCWAGSGDGGGGAAGGITAPPQPVPVPDGGDGGWSGDAGGGGIYIWGGSPLIQNCLIEDCFAMSGDGGDGGNGADATPTPNADPNHPGGRGGDGGIAGFARGGGIYCSSGSPTFENVIVRNCSAIGGTGGDGGDGGANGNTFQWPVTTGGRGGDGGVPMPVFGGGVCCEPVTTPTFINCTIVDCLAQGGRGGNGGNSGGDVLNWWRGGIGGLTLTEDLMDIVETYYEFPPQYYGPGSYEFYFGTDDYFAPYNFSTYGGGVSCGYVSNSRFVNCDISDNVTIGAISGFGGQDSYGLYFPPYRYWEMPSYGSGAYIGRSTTAVFLDSTIQNNRANYPGYPNTDPNYEHLGYGGGICIRAGRFISGQAYGIARFNNCQITGNTSPIGGGIYATALTNLDIIDTNIVDNLAYAGAGIFTVDNINAYIARCDFVNNRADNSVYPENPDPNVTEASIPGAGGGLFLFTTDVLVEDCRITDNNATGLGGGLYMGGLPSSLSEHFDVKPRINNCLVVNNITNFNGAGVCSSWSVDSTITNCTLADNTAAVSGGGIYCSYDSTTKLKNSIVWNNSAASGPEMALNDNNPYNPAPTTLNVSYSDVRDGQSGAFIGTDSVLNWGSGNIEDNPMFVTGDLGTRYLSQVSAGQATTSPCVDTGSTFAKYLGLQVYTTSTNNSPDRNLADIGYHYKTYVAIPGDFDHDGDVDLDDLSILLSYWLEQNCGLLNDCEGADFEPDGDVDWYDYTRFTEIYYLENIVDTTAPQPNPMTWEMKPSILSYHSVIMTATTATDESGVLYYFDCNSGDCHDSGWQDSPTYTDTGLADNAAYTYRVRASDKSPIKNTTGWSSQETVIIPSSDIDIFPPEPNPSTWEIEPFEETPFVISMTATTATDASPPIEYYFKCASGPGNDSGWQLSSTYLDNVSTNESFYYYTVKAKDAYGFDTFESQQRRVWIDHRPPQPDPITWAQEPNAISEVAITMKATTATDPCGVEYYFACTSGGGHDRGWQADPSYTDTGLSEGTTYTYKVQTRDKSPNYNEGGWSDVNSAKTWEDYDPPQPYPAEWAEGGEPNAVPGQYKITMTAKTATDVSGVEYYFECTYGDGNDSDWQDSPTYTDMGPDGLGLDVNEIHTYRVRTRDKAVPPNPDQNDPNKFGWSTEKSALIDFIAPTPNPAEWAVDEEPYEDYNDTKGCYQHRMTAKKATDDNGMDPNAGIFDPNRVEYYFECLNSDDLCSGWQDSPVYDVDVPSAGLLYAYRVKARDKSTNHNETGYSDWLLAIPKAP